MWVKTGEYTVCQLKGKETSSECVSTGLWSVRVNTWCHVEVLKLHVVVTAEHNIYTWAYSENTSAQSTELGSNGSSKMT